MAKLKPRPKPIITVFRKYTRDQPRCWYYDGGQAIEMSPALAEIEARKGQITLKTIDRQGRAH